MVAMIAMKSSVVVIVSVVVGFGTSLSAATAATTTSTTLVQPSSTTPHTRRGAAPSNTHRTACMAFVDTGPFYLQKQRQQLEHSGGHCRKTTAVFVERTTRRIPTPPGYTNGQPLPQPYSQRTHYKYLETLPQRSTRTTLWESNSGSSSNSGSTGSSNLVASSDVVKTQLLSAFTNLGVSDQYDAVLTGLCAKILDSTPTTRQRQRQQSVDEGDASETDEEAAAATAASRATPDVTLTDCLDLLQEMNSQRIVASPRSLMALIDSTVKAQDAAVMANVVSQCIRNTNGLRQYGMQQTDVLPFPTSYTSKVSTPGSGNGKKTILERLEPLPNVPTDDRGRKLPVPEPFYQPWAVVK